MNRAAVQEKPQVEATGAVAEAPTCQHHWLIESPRGATSRGRCKRCGEEREFRNSATDYLWEDESSSGYNAWRGVRSAARRETADEEEAAVAGSGRRTTLVL